LKEPNTRAVWERWVNKGGGGEQKGSGGKKKKNPNDFCPPR